MTTKEILDELRNGLFTPENSEQLYEMSSDENRYMQYVKEQVLQVDPNATTEQIYGIQMWALGAGVKAAAEKKSPKF
jgi:hypothetical protein